MAKKKKTHKYPEPDDICINESDLRIKFQEFYKAVKGEFSALDLFIIIPAWIPIFTSSFRDIAGFSGSSLMGAYSAVVGASTLIWIGRRHWFKRVWQWFKREKNRLLNLMGGSREIENVVQNINNPEDKVENIKEECSK